MTENESKDCRQSSWKKKQLKNPTPCTNAKPGSFCLDIFVYGVWLFGFFFINSLNWCLSTSLRPYQEAHFSYPSISFLQNTTSSEVSLSEIKESRLNQKISSCNIMDIPDFF